MLQAVGVVRQKLDVLTEMETRKLGDASGVDEGFLSYSGDTSETR